MFIILIHSIRQAVISLLEKPGKIKCILKAGAYWIVIIKSCWNVLQKDLNEYSWQSSRYRQRSNISESIRTIINILDDTAKRYLLGISLTIDYEKAFDTLNWTFWEKDLTAFNLGNSAIR